MSARGGKEAENADIFNGSDGFRDRAFKFVMSWKFTEILNRDLLIFSIPAPMLVFRASPFA